MQTQMQMQTRICIREKTVFCEWFPMGNFVVDDVSDRVVVVVGGLRWSRTENGIDRNLADPFQSTIDA